MRKWIRCCLALVSVTGILLSAALAQTAHDRDNDKDRDNPAARAAWFYQGRHSPDALPAAAHRLRAARQSLRLRTISPRAGGMATAGVSASWTELGPRPEVLQQYGNVSGRVTALAADLVNDPTGNTVYAGTAFGGVWKSTNALAASPTFTPISDQSLSLAVGSIALDTSTNPATIHVGTGEANFAGDSYYGIGILKSPDGGKTWTLSASADNGVHPFSGLAFSSVVVDPSNPKHILAASTGATGANGLSPAYGIYVSNDGGQSWTLDASPSGHSVTALTWDAQNHVFYAAVRSEGIFKSADGKTWTACASPFAAQAPVSADNFNRASLATRNGTVYALISGSTGVLSQPSASDTGIVQSADGGSTWTAIADPSPLSDFFSSNNQGFYDQYIAAPAGSTNLIIAGIDVWSTPAVTGSSTVWTNLTNAYGSGTVHPDEHAIAVIKPNTWVIGNDGGVWSTADAGATWSNLNATLGNIQFTSITPDPAKPGYVLGGSQDNGTAISAPNSLTWTMVDGGDGGFTDANPNNTAISFTEQYGLSLESIDNQNQALNPVVDSTLIPDQGAFYIPYEVMPSHPSQILLGTCRVWKGPGQPAATDANWAPISGDLTGSGSAGCSASNGNINDLASAPGDGRVIYAVTDTGTVQVTTNADAATPTWTDVTSAPLPTGGIRPFSSVAVSPTDPNTVYVGVMGFGTGHVFKSTNAGQTWTDITGSLPDAPVNTILIDPQNTNDIYVGSDVGVFVATDGGVSGESWQRMGAGLPDTPVVQLKIAETGNRSLIAATHGRGAWAMAPLTDNPDFTLHLNADGEILASSGDATLTASLTAISGYAKAVSLSCTAPSSGCSVSPAAIQPGQTATVTVSASALTNSDTVVTIHATDGAIIHDRNADVELASLSVSPPALQVSPGGNAVATVTGQNLPGAETLTCPDAPSGITCNFASSTIDPVNTQVQLQVAANGTIAGGAYTFHVSAASKAQTLTTPVSVNVAAFGLTSPNGGLVTIPASTTSATFPISIQSASGFSSSVALSCSGTGSASCSFSPATISGGQTSTLTVSNLGNLANGQLQFTVTGVSGTETETLNLTVRVVDFSLSALQTSVTAANGAATFTLNAKPVNGYSQPLTFACTGQGSATCTFNPSPDTPGQPVTLTVSGLTQTSGSLNFQVSASDGALAHTLPLTVNFTDFTLGAIADTSIPAGTDTASFTVTTAAQNGFTGQINLSCGAITGAPAAACSFNPATVAAGQSSTVTVSGLKAVAAQDLVIDVTGASGSLTHDTTATVHVQDFTVGVTNGTASVAVGTDTTAFTVQTSAVNGYSGTIALSCSGLDAKAACSFSPASVTAGQTSTLTVSGLKQEALAGNDALSFKAVGSASGISHSANLHVQIQDISSGNSSSGWATPTASVTAGSTAQVALNYTSLNGFAGQVAMSCSGLPANATCKFSPASFTLTAGVQQSVTLSMTTTAHSLLPPAPASDTPAPGSGELLLGLLGLAGLLMLGLTSRRRVVAIAGALLLGTLLLAGCGGGGGGGGGNSIPYNQTGTPAGTYTVQAIATANGVSHSTAVTLTVQ